jgi:hypothetical protein
MINWSIAGKVLDIYDDPKMDVIQEHGDLEKLGSLVIDTKDELKAFPDNNFALILEDEAGKLHRKFPVTSEDQVKLSMFYLGQTGDRMLPLARNTAAKNLVKVAAQLDLEIPEALKEWSEQEAGRVNFVGYRDQIKHADANFKYVPGQDGMNKESEDALPEAVQDGFVAACLARAELVPDQAVKSELRKLAQAGVGQDPDSIIKILKQVDDFYDLSKYASKIGTPEQAVCMTLGPEPDVIKAGSLSVQVDDLHKLSRREDLLKDVFHPGTMHEFMAGPEDVFKSLPEETQEFVVKELIPKLE